MLGRLAADFESFVKRVVTQLVKELQSSVLAFDYLGSANILVLLAEVYNLGTRPFV